MTKAWVHKRWWSKPHDFFLLLLPAIACFHGNSARDRAVEKGTPPPTSPGNLYTSMCEHVKVCAVHCVSSCHDENIHSQAFICMYLNTADQCTLVSQYSGKMQLSVSLSCEHINVCYPVDPAQVWPHFLCAASELSGWSPCCYVPDCLRCHPSSISAPPHYANLVFPLFPHLKLSETPSI